MSETRGGLRMSRRGDTAHGLASAGFNGTYNRLYTVTAQCKEDEIDRFGSELKKVVASFVPPKVVGGLAMKL